jgi:pantoate--beta-alanine ligase
MQVTENLAELRVIRRSLDGSFGLIPTMGALHAGHGSLVSRARKECNHVGVSIFVNPAQFSPGEDYANYPRTIQPDLDFLKSLGVDVVWMPTAEFLYPPGFQTWITIEEISAPLEGKSRPGHFRGVATIVAKLLNAFAPDRAYFGQKDAQQVVVLKRMVQDLNFPVELVVCSTVRESDGLALSSRNAYLSAAERQAAVVLYRALCAAQKLHSGGERDAEVLRAAMFSEIQSEPLAQAQYISVADPETLCELGQAGANVLFSLAVRIGKTRLIDNFLLGSANNAACN